MQINQEFVMFQFLKQLAANAIKIVIKRPKPKVPMQPTGDLTHYLNDPTTPDLIEKISYDDATNRIAKLDLKFVVDGFAGGGHDLNSSPGRAANCCVTTLKTLEWVQAHKFKKIPNWATTQILSVQPDAGEDLNAYYDRTAVKLFSLKNWHTSNSCDILAHELGHAIFDALRPDTWSVQAIEIWAFHETFGDLSALFTVLQSDKMIEKMLSETNGDLSKSNAVSKVAEEVGKVVYDLTGGEKGRDPAFLRNAANDFKYVDPTTLSEEETYDTISAECHSFSRILTGTMYEIFVMMYNQCLSQGMKNTDAVKAARDTLIRYALRAACFVPAVPKFYEAFAKTVLWVDWSTTKEYHDRMWEIFERRGIISSVKSMAVKRRTQVIGQSIAKGRNGSTLVKGGKIETRKLADLMPISAQSYNPLYYKNIELASESIYIFEKNGHSFEYMEPSEKEQLKAAKYCLDRLHQTNSVSNDPKTPFVVKRGKLIRTNYKCLYCR